MYLNRLNKKSWVRKLIDWIPGFDSHLNMDWTSFIATDTIKHRYAHPQVLRDILTKEPFNFRDQDITIKVCYAPISPSD